MGWIERTMPLLCLLLLALPAIAASKEEGPEYPRILNCYGIGLGKGASDEAIREAAKYDLLAGGVDLDAGAVIARLRKLNPSIKILPYVILREADANDKTIPEAWWAKDAEGGKFSFWPGTYVFNLLLPAVQDWLVDRCAKILADPKKFDGIFFDGYDSGIDYLNHEHPGDIDLDGDGKRDDPKLRDAKWRAAEESVIRRVSALRGGKVLLMANTWAFPDWVPVKLLNGVLAEDQIGRIRREDLTLDQFVAGYLKAEADSRSPVVVGIVNGGSDLEIRQYLALSEDEKAAEREKIRAEGQKMRFGLCAALMGDGYYGYDLGPIRGQHWLFPEYAKIGHPSGIAKKLPNGLWIRRFKAKDGETVAVVNGTESPLTYESDDAMKNVSTGETAKRFVIPALDGAILKRE